MQSGFRRMVWALVAAGGLAQGAAQAASFDGQYLKGSFNELGLGAFSNVQLQETPFTWDCTASACTVRDLPTISVVFGSTSGQPVALESKTTFFSGQTTQKTNVDVIDPLGHHWGVASADLGKWSVGVNVASQTPPAGDAQFATAYGQFRVTSEFGYGVPPTWPTGAWPAILSEYEVFPGLSLWDATSEVAVLGLHQTGLVQTGPGDQGWSTVAHSGDLVDSSFDWRFWTGVTGAYYAFPSTTDTSCQSLSCMNFKRGQVNVSSFVLNIGVTAVPSPVPEADSMLMALVGVGVGLSLLITRRQPR